MSNILLVTTHFIYMSISISLAEFLHPSFGNLKSDFELSKSGYLGLDNEEHLLLSCFKQSLILSFLNKVVKNDHIRVTE